MENVCNDKDIRFRNVINHDDIVSLNFFRDSGKFILRKHFTQGLRSHVIEVLRAEDVNHESQGIMSHGILKFPQAVPQFMLRIFKSCFNSTEEVFEEVKKIKIMETFLPKDHMAISNEFIVDYLVEGRCDICLCGFQEYVSGEPLDPWSSSPCDHVNRPELFISYVKNMIKESSLIPDLAGFGNLKVDEKGKIRLVDINNISKVVFDDTIHLDNNGYPVLDKSIEALSRLEQRLLNQPLNKRDRLYNFFLEEKRTQQVRNLEKNFIQKFKNNT